MALMLGMCMQGKEVSALTSSGNIPTSPYTYWVTPEAEAAPSDSPPSRITVSIFQPRAMALAADAPYNTPMK